MYLANVKAEIKLNPLDFQRLFLIPSVTLIFGSARIWYMFYLLYIALEFQVLKFIQEYFNNHSAESLMQSLALQR